MAQWRKRRRKTLSDRGIVGAGRVEMYLIPVGRLSIPQRKRQRSQPRALARMGT